MSFNVSRFLVRVRQFWTRERLVPVLGVTALFMFGLLWQNFIANLFADKPIIAQHIVIDGEAFGEHDIRFFERDRHEANRFHFEFEFDEESEHKHRHHRHHHKRFKVWRNGDRFEHELEEELTRELEGIEEELELKLKALEEELEEIEIEKHVLKFKTGDNDEDIIILNGDESGSVEITVNGKKLQINTDSSI